MNQLLHGIIPPLVTPLSDNGNLDIEGLERLIEHTIKGGVHGIFILGSSGEFASLNNKLQQELIENTCKIVNGRVKVLAGISDPVFSDSVNLARCASHNGADAVMLTPPYYFTLSQPELLEYLRRIMGQIQLPLLLYNIPAFAKIIFEPDTVKKAASIPGITGIKDSSSNLVYLKHVQYELRDNSDFSFFVGQEEYMSEFVLTGGHGGINGGANMFPKLYVRLYNASVNHDFDTIHVLQQKVMQINSTIYKVGSNDSSYLKGLKCALSVIGICNDFMAEPFQRFIEPERRIIKQLLDDLNYTELL